MRRRVGSTSGGVLGRGVAVSRAVRSCWAHKPHLRRKSAYQRRSSFQWRKNEGGDSASRNTRRQASWLTRRSHEVVPHPERRRGTIVDKDIEQREHGLTQCL